MDGQHYRALSQSRLKAGAAYHLSDLTMPSHVNLNSPAVDVMTDLRHTAAVTTTLDTLIDDANREMISHGIRTLIVVDNQRRVVGIITSTDILGEKPMQITHERGIRHAEILVRDVMTPAHRLEVIDLQEVLNAKVGDVLETLRRARRQHALVVDQLTGEQEMVRGIFSATQIARQLDIAPSPPETGDTFAEIETAIGS
ncbi:MAG: CBS domain-containing protein [Burkholderiaceae bacterium]